MTEHFISDWEDWRRRRRKKILGERIKIFTLKNPEAELCIGIFKGNVLLL